MSTYIAGPMTGLPEFNYPAFNYVAEQLRAKGIDVENPAENVCPHDDPTWQDWMRLGIAQLIRCDEIVLLPNWRHSPGAVMERYIAVNLGMRVTEWEATV